VNDLYTTPFNDEPITDVDDQDLLGRRQLLNEVKHAISQGTPPQVFGIHGDWGSGKTSFLRQVRYELTGERVLGPHEEVTDDEQKKADKYAAEHPHITAIWFEAWRYQNESAPIVALLHEIRSQMTWRSHAAAKTTQAVKKYSAVAIRGGLLQMEQVTKMIGFQASKVQEAGETWEREHLAVALPSDQIRALLDEVLGQLLPETGKRDKKWDANRRLVVFIDDLDRCEPETAFRLLEGIKIYLNLTRCVFVLGLNQREIERAIAKFIPSAKSEKDDGELLIRAQEYMEKLCGNILHLPLPNGKRQAALVEKLLEKVAADKRAEAVCARIFRLIAEVPPILPANPRRIKSFCNTVARLLWRRLQSLPKGASIPENEARVVLLVASLYQFHPAIYRVLASDLRFIESVKIKAREVKLSAAADSPPVHKELDSLKLTFHRTAAGEQSAVPDDMALPLSPLFADPAYGNVLYCQRLLAAEGAAEITENDLQPYMGDA
jgi:hypothetical protein